MLAYTTMDEANFPDEDAFLKGTGDAYGLYQLKGGSENRTVRFASLSMLQHLNQAVEKDKELSMNKHEKKYYTSAAVAIVLAVILWVFKTIVIEN